MISANKKSQCDIHLDHARCTIPYQARPQMERRILLLQRLRNVLDRDIRCAYLRLSHSC
jgi:hypothetical protein